MLPVQTAGCVSFHLGAAPDAANIVLKAEDMQTLARWVVPSKTVYVALPKEAYKSLKASWRLP
jgi:predicted PhzF superfamily epimerase YddE/YHI9